MTGCPGDTRRHTRFSRTSPGRLPTSLRTPQPALVIQPVAQAGDGVRDAEDVREGEDACCRPQRESRRRRSCSVNSPYINGVKSGHKVAGLSCRPSLGGVNSNPRRPHASPRRFNVRLTGGNVCACVGGPTFNLKNPSTSCQTSDHHGVFKEYSHVQLTCSFRNRVRKFFRKSVYHFRCRVEMRE